MRRRKAAVIVSVCSVAVVLSLLFLYISEFPFFHKSGVMTVGQLNTGINYWRSFYVGRTVTVRGTLEHFIAPDVPFTGLQGLDNLRGFPFNGLLKDDYLNETRAAIGVNLNWTKYSSLLGRDVIVKGVISTDGRSVYIEAEYVAPLLINAF
jgi:hypothetical protein